MTRTLALVPDDARYAATLGPAVRRDEVDGGRARHRLDQVGAPALVDCRWDASAVEHDYLLAFYRTVIAEGAGPFFASLILDGFATLTYSARFMPPGMRLTGQSGETYQLTARLEVMPLVRDDSLDRDLIDSYAEAAEDGLEVMGIDPGSSSYSVTRGDELIQAKPSMGPAGIRAGLQRQSATVKVSWTTNPRGYEYLMAFYFTGIREGALPFRITLILDRSAPTEYVALLIPGSLSLDGARGATYGVSAELEIVPEPRNAVFDAAVLAAFPGAP